MIGTGRARILESNSNFQPLLSSIDLFSPVWLIVAATGGFQKGRDRRRHRRTPRSKKSGGLHKASIKVVEILTAMAIPVELSDHDSLIKSTSTSLNSKVVSQYSSLLASLAVDAVLSVVDPAKPDLVDLKDIKIVKKLGIENTDLCNQQTQIDVLCFLFGCVNCEASVNLMNALIESCVKSSAANLFVSLEDDIGMNLFASVAIGDMSRFDLVSCTDSPERSAPIIDEIFTHDHAKSKLSPDSQIAGDRSLCSNVVDGDSKYPGIASNSSSENGLHISKHASLEHFSERRCSSSHANEDLLITECIEPLNLAYMDLRTSADPHGDISEKSSEMKSSASLMLSGLMEKMRDGVLGRRRQAEAAGVAVKEMKFCKLKLIGAPDTIKESRGLFSKTDHYLPIHREAPAFVEQATEQQILVTGIKVVDLLAPYQRGGKIGQFGGAG
ncbi:unnamed protein product [Fraxinus pennsylvanica]|uniref:Uncharacterized protein n=1 Tax=Fraxinus pennsylvanica TaxID=56036 RepID=A0AAD2DW37_9LAMI|nr:unnamed protein product [Fraxinus pennsylvanica]